MFRPARFPHTEAALICCICCWSCWAILFCSLSFCVSTNFYHHGGGATLRKHQNQGSNSSFWVRKSSFPGSMGCTLILFSAKWFSSLTDTSGKGNLKGWTSCTMLTLKKAPVFRMFGWLTFQGFPGGISGKPPASAGELRDRGSIPGTGRAPGEAAAPHSSTTVAGKSPDRAAWWATVREGCKVSHTLTRVTSL